jgi:hypothetical protein
VRVKSLSKRATSSISFSCKEQLPVTRHEIASPTCRAGRASANPALRLEHERMIIQP